MAIISLTSDKASESYLTAGVMMVDQAVSRTFLNSLLQRKLALRFLGSLVVLGLLLRNPSQAAITTSSSNTGIFNWSALTWDNGVPDGIGDIAQFSSTADTTITLNQTPVTLGRLSIVPTTGNFTLSGSGSNKFVFDNSVDPVANPVPAFPDLASILFSRTANDSLARAVNANLDLNSNLVVTWGRVQARDDGLGGVIAGNGRLSLNYAIVPTEGPDTAVPVNLNGASHRVIIGNTSTASPNTYTGGTDLRAANATFTSIEFRAAKTNAFGTGRLFMHQAALNLQTFNQTVGGLSGGTGSSKISSLSGTVGTTTLNLDFSSSNGPFSFSGAIQDGATRLLALNKLGSGTQTLSADNTYSGGTTINGGTLLVTNTAGSGTGSGLVTVNDTGTFGGTGIVTGPVQLTNGGKLSPGMSAGTLNLANTLTFGAGSILEFDVGTAADLIQFTSPGAWLVGSGLGELNLVLESGFDYGQSYKLFDDVTTTGFSFASITGYDSVNYTASVNQVGSDYFVSFVNTIPEPSTYLVCAFSCCMLLGLRRRK